MTSDISQIAAGHGLQARQHQILLHKQFGMLGGRLIQVAVSLALPAVFCLSCSADRLMASLFLTFIGECRLGVTPVGEA